MHKNTQSSRSLTAFLVTWAFIVLTVTGLVLYIVPHGRVAYWVHWSLLGLEKEQWGWIHMMFGGVLIVTGFLHLYFNWKPFKKYLAERVKGQLELSREVVIASALTVFIVVVSALNVPPASWIIDLNTTIKNAWVSSPELEPPYGHAEESSLAAISRKMGLDLDRGMGALRERGIRFEGKRDTLEHIARNNGVRPMDIYEIIQPHKLPEPQVDNAPATAEEIEAQYAGTGLGRKTLAEICEQTGTDLALALQRLESAGIQASADDRARPLADKYDRRPMDLLVIMMLPQ